MTRKGHHFHVCLIPTKWDSLPGKRSTLQPAQYLSHLEPHPSTNKLHWPAHADRKIALLGAIQSLFEASMYTFVFLWTPALSPDGEKVAHGMIFACFMMSCMAGSTIAGRLLSDSKRYAVSHYMKVLLSLQLPGRCTGTCRMQPYTLKPYKYSKGRTASCRKPTSRSLPWPVCSHPLARLPPIHCRVMHMYRCKWASSPATNLVTQDYACPGVFS